MKKKVLSFCLAMVLAISLLVGCGAQKQEAPAKTAKGNEAKEPAAAKTEDPAKEELSGLLISKEPQELTLHLHIYNKFVFNDSWVSFQKAAELTNIKMKGVAQESATDSGQVFNVMMASGELPDIIVAERENFFKYGPEGAFLPLNDLIDQYAPNIKKFLAEREDIRKYLTAPDGNIYSINFVPDGAAAQGYFIRQDWLDKLGLERPKTVEEVYTVLKAFREKDPNGNGQKDEIPYIDRANGAKTVALSALWGAHTYSDKDHWFLDKDEVKFGPMQTEYKEAMLNLSKWYAEGLIDPEAFTRGKDAREILLGDNVGGFTHDWFASTASANDKFQSKIEGFNFAPMLPPADAKGKVWEYASRPAVNPTGWGLSKDIKDPVIGIKYLDFWWTEEGRRLMNFGIEGEDYDMIDGKPIFKESVLKGDEPVISYLQKKGVQIQIGFHQDFNYEKQWMNALALEGAEMYNSSNVIAERFPMLSFTVEEQKILDQKETAIQPFVEEMTQKWILGAEDVEKTWDSYLQSLNDLGMKEIVEIYQAAYDRYAKQ